MKHLTTSQAAAKLGLSISRIQQFIREGRLPAEKVGRDWLIREEDLKLVENRKPGRPSKQASTKKKAKK
jgi:excisionase family DNA binding protein